MEGPIPPVTDLLASIRSSCQALRLESNILVRVFFLWSMCHLQYSDQLWAF